MGLFGNKDKKFTKINNQNKAQILSIIEQAKMSCKDANALSALKAVQTQLQSQSETSKKEVIDIDSQILKLLADANTFILKQQFPTAITKLNKALNLSIDRQQYCLLGGTQTKADAKRAKETEKFMSHVKEAPKTRTEQLQADIDEKNAELSGLIKEFEGLEKLYRENPKDTSIIAQATAVKTKIQVAKNSINNLKIELEQEVVNEGVISIAEQNEELEKGRTYTEAEMEINRAKLAQQNAAREEQSARIAADASLLGQGAASLFGDPFADAAETLFGNPFETQSTAATGATMGTQVQAQYGTFNASEVGSTAMANDIKRTLQALERSLDQLDEKIEDANDELNDYNAELRPLLTRRQTASPSDCLVLDGQIDQINAKRNSVIYKIKRLRQNQAKLNDQRSLMEKLNTQQDITATNAQIEQLTGGKFSDLAGLSMFLNDSVKQSNEELEEIGAAISVAENEEIMMNSASAGAAILTDVGTISKDEDKYLALQQELGMPMM